MNATKDIIIKVIFPVWKYISKIPDINSDKVEKRLKVMHKQYKNAVKMFDKYKKIKNEEDKKKFMAEITPNVVGVYLSQSMLSQSGVSMTASFKDSVGIEHRLKISHICFSNRMIQFFRWYLGRRVGVYCRNIFIDDKQIIDTEKMSFIKPDYMDKVSQFMDEIGLKK